ncbi:MAG: DUF131 domain-containing protein [Thermoplasmata archaeon]|nr:DUF131 domain-containing protein [Thermoplasmata archaeon]
MGIAISCFFYGVFKGEVQAGIVLIFPFLVGSGFFSLLGTIFLILAIFSFVAGFMVATGVFETRGAGDEHRIYSQGHGKPDAGVDGIVLIGPFPVIFSTKKSHLVYLVIIAFALAVGVLGLFLFLVFFT